MFEMLEISLLGQTEVRHRDRRLGLADFEGAKPRQVLELLALERGQVVPKARLADLLWEGRPPRGYVATLEAYVSLLRRALEPGVRPRQSVVRTVPGGYLLDTTRVQVDLDVFEGLAARAARLPAGQALPVLLEALAVCRGEVLAHERYAGWAEEARRCHGQRQLRVTASAARYALDLGDTELAVTLAERAAALDPLAEDAWRLAIEGHWRAGRRVDALRAFSTLRRHLVHELGIEPGRTTQLLHQAVLRDEPVAVSA